MANYVIENVDPLAPKSVCIYVVSPDGTLVPKDITQFTNLDAFGKGLGINLLRGYNVSCVGAYPYAGAIEVVVFLACQFSSRMQNSFCVLPAFYVAICA